MASTFSLKFGNFLYKNCFPLYKTLYSVFKNKQDAAEISLLKQIIRPGDNIIDIGANIGFYARILSDLTGKNGKVYCFEPDSTNFNYLQKATHGRSNIQVFNMAVSDSESVLKVYKSKLLNVDHRTYPVNNYDSIEEVKANSIDNLIASRTILPVNVIKIDIQGFELFSFRGMNNLLRTSSDLKIVAEFWPHGFMRAGSSAIELFDFFDALGYSIYFIGENENKKVTKDYVIHNNQQPFEFSFNVLIRK
jgi:FkbM family methyltransferase